MTRRPLRPLAALVIGVALTGPARADAQSTPGAPAPSSRDAGRPLETSAGDSNPGAGTAGQDHVHAGDDAPSQDLPPFLPPVTDEDRKAAFPDVDGHTVHDQTVHSYVLLDQLEWQARPDGGVFSLDGRGWIGGDRDRVWFRAEGGSEDGRVDEAHAHILYGRHFSRWWDVVGGIRQDFRPGPAQTWAAVGIQGLAPYWFEVEATAYIGASGRTEARVEVEYELLLTNRLVLQPLVEAELVGKSDPERGSGAGLSATEAGFRVRYEIRRELAPYAGVVWRNKWGKTAGFAEARGEETGGARFAAGLRLWF